MKGIEVEESLDEFFLSLLYDHFKEYTGCDWTIEQFIQSLKNQEYLKFLVFKKGSDIVGIVSYSVSNPWDKVMYDIEYSIDEKMANYLKGYKKEVLK